MNTRKTMTILIILTLMVSTTGLWASGSKETHASQHSNASSGVDSDQDGIPDAAEQLLGSNPYAADTDGDGIADAADDAPVSAENLFSSSSQIPMPLTVADIRVEDNFKADDHLELTLKNTGSQDLSIDSGYLTITDRKKGSTGKESYMIDLSGLTVKGYRKQTIHFDNQAKSGHFPGNTNGLYRTAADGLTFSLTLYSEGFAPLLTSVDKAPGTAEVAD